MVISDLNTHLEKKKEKIKDIHICSACMYIIYIVRTLLLVNNKNIIHLEDSFGKAYNVN